MLFFFNFGPLIYLIVLLLNAVAILSEDRFLARVGWGPSQQDAGFGASHDSASLKSRAVLFIHTVRTGFRVPLILANTAIIFYELILG